MPIDTDEERVSAQTTAILDLANESEDIEVTILHVFADRDRAAETSPTRMPHGRTVQERLVDAGVAVETISRSGEPAAEILATAREIGTNLIVLGGRKRSSLGTLVFGSVSQDVVLNASQPVTITGSAADLERPSHRCANCGEAYYTRPDAEISTCRNCGGVNVERIHDESMEAHL